MALGATQEVRSLPRGVYTTHQAAGYLLEVWDRCQGVGMEWVVRFPKPPPPLTLNSQPKVHSAPFSEPPNPGSTPDLGDWAEADISTHKSKGQGSLSPLLLFLEAQKQSKSSSHAKKQRVRQARKC